MKRTRIVQLTDIHLLPEVGDRVLEIDSCESLNDIFSDVLSLNKSPELILVTGDLAEDGSIRSYKRLRDIFESTACSFFVVPGNHDDVDNIKESLVNETIKMQPATEIDGWVIAFVNSQAFGHDHGLIDQVELIQLESVLQKAKGKPCMVALHHSPTPECDYPGCQLNNAQEFLELLDRYPNVKVVIAGHTHCCTEVQHNKIKLLTTPSTFLHASHSKQGESEDHNDFGKSHELDSSRRGYRIIDLFENGDFNSEVRWV